VWAAGPKRGGKLAVTHVRVVSRRGNRTLVEAALETGRKHQIRVQLADAGHPILGDRRYGTPGRTERRLALHAAVLRLRHPTTGEILEFRSPAPWSKRSPDPRRKVNRSESTTAARDRPRSH
jgi:23S rRNA-/tRNA-specific pseudouridylate synthase